ncbi:hypothetical protein [Actinosynnema mirum]|uniref:hypothetical protein n=1 Tax=Actinosynnema mirum TaxID=40567 RepID=UPI00019AB95D|nr:hypothetical protein [Actinosynnema mirum]
MVGDGPVRGGAAAVQQAAAARTNAPVQIGTKRVPGVVRASVSATAAGSSGQVIAKEGTTTVSARASSSGPWSAVIE